MDPISLEVHDGAGVGFIRVRRDVHERCVPALSRALRVLVEGRLPAVVLEIARDAVVGCGGLQAVARALEDLRRQGRRLLIVSDNPRTRGTLLACGLALEQCLFETREAALRALAESPALESRAPADRARQRRQLWWGAGSAALVVQLAQGAVL